MGGNPRKGVLFEGPPGTGKTYMAKAMAHEAGVPFLFVSSTAFQSQYYGATGRKIRNYFKELRKAAAEEGGAIGFIEEIDAIAGARSGMRSSPYADAAHERMFGADPNSRRVERNSSEGISGVVNELLIQMQSFDTPTGGHKLSSWWIDVLNRHLPTHRRISKSAPKPSNILLIAATNRAADLDPALLRPGRFDRSIHFDLPSRSGRRDIIDYYLDRKAHVPELDKEERRDALAAMTFGYTPVMIEHLFDEGLVWALRDGQVAMDWERRAAGEDDRGDRSEAAGRVHRRGAAHDRDARGRSRDGRVPRRPEPQARGALDHQAPRRARPARAQRRRGALHAHALRAARDDEDRVRRHERRGAVLRRVGHRSRRATSCTRRGSRRRWSARSAWPDRSSRYEAIEAGPISQGIVGKVLGNEDARAAVEKLLAQAKADVQLLLDDHRHLVIALRDELLANGPSSSATRSSTCCARPRRASVSTTAERGAAPRG